jgi:hypothetical protein
MVVTRGPWNGLRIFLQKDARGQGIVRKEDESAGILFSLLDLPKPISASPKALIFAYRSGVGVTIEICLSTRPVLL